MNASNKNSPGEGRSAGDPAPPSFFCDTMLGRLARWLRLLGYDTAYEREIDDWDLVQRASREGRVLLTRDRDVLKRWQITRGRVMAHLIEPDDAESQIAGVKSSYALKALDEARCPEDNHRLRPLPREQVRDRVPPYVFKTQSEFRSCPGCGRVYWKATHWERIEKIREA